MTKLKLRDRVRCLDTNTCGTVVAFTKDQKPIVYFDDGAKGTCSSALPLRPVA